MKRSVKAEGPFKCAYCTGTFDVGYTNDKKEDPVILHTLPTCAGYNKLNTVEDAIQYMRAARGS